MQPLPAWISKHPENVLCGPENFFQHTVSVRCHELLPTPTGHLGKERRGVKWEIGNARLSITYIGIYITASVKDC